MFSDEFEVKGGFSNCLISFHFLRFVVSSLSSSFLFVAIQHDYNPRILLRPYNGPFLFFFWHWFVNVNLFFIFSVCLYFLLLLCQVLYRSNSHGLSFGTSSLFSSSRRLGFLFMTCYTFYSFLFVLISFPHHGPLGS